MSYETLLVDARDGIASVTLNRPEVRNALNATLIRELEQALAELEADPAAMRRALGQGFNTATVRLTLHGESEVQRDSAANPGAEYRSADRSA